MRVRFTCRQTRLTPALREFTQEKLQRLDRYLDENAEVHVVLTVEKRRHPRQDVLRIRRRRETRRTNEE